MTERIIIIGGGVTGMAAAIASGGTILEAKDVLGGLADCTVKDVYVLGYSGHWLFGGSPTARSFVSGIVLCREATKETYAWIKEQYIPAPIQNNVGVLDNPPRIYAEIAHRPSVDAKTFAQYLRLSYGDTLYRTFFWPFNDKYTCGLMHEVEPMHTRNVVPTLESLLSGKGPATYNDKFMYAIGGIDQLAGALADKCGKVILGANVTHVDPGRHLLVTTNDVEHRYDKLISTVPLNRLADMCGISHTQLPYLSCVVVNVGCEFVNFPGQWVYVPDSDIGFHRIGNYTAVDKTLAPSGKHLIYLDANAHTDDVAAMAANAGKLVDDAVRAGFIDGVTMYETRTIPVAYTFTKHGQHDEISGVLDYLSGVNIFSIGGYGRWQYQGMMADIEEGFRVGAMVRRM